MKKIEATFFVHMGEIGDVNIAFPIIPRRLIERSQILQRILFYLLGKLSEWPGFIVRSRFKISKNIKGRIVLLLITAKQIKEDPRKAKTLTIKAALNAQKNAQKKGNLLMVGLGGYTKRFGPLLIKKLDKDSVVTDGDALPILIALQDIQLITAKVGLELTEATVAIIGADGIIGRGLSRQLESRVRKLIPVGKKQPINVTLEADIVITATTAPEAIINSSHLKYGAIVIEIAEPRNVSKSVLEERQDVLVLDGSRTRIPEKIKPWDMGLYKGVTFSCFTQLMEQALAGDLTNRVGDTDPDFFETLRQWMKEHGFSAAPFLSFNKLVSEERLQRQAQFVKRKKTKKRELVSQRSV